MSLINQARMFAAIALLQGLGDDSKSETPLTDAQLAMQDARARRERLASESSRAAERVIADKYRAERLARKELAWLARQPKANP